MTRILPSSIYKRIYSHSFKSNPYILNKIDYERFLYKNNQPNNGEYDSITVISTHSSVKLHPALQYSLIKNNILTKLNEIQESSYLSIVSGKDVTIHSPTGTGKTIAYLLPIINNVYHIHDMLEKLMIKSDSGTSQNEIRMRNLSIGRTNKLRHSLIPSIIDNYSQDLDDLEQFGNNMYEKYKGGTTLEKLLDVLYFQNPNNLKLIGLPNLPTSIWKKRSRNSIYRNIMANPLGSVRCVVILVPNKDLVSQVLSYIDKIDILGRLSVQTLTSIPLIRYDSNTLNKTDNKNKSNNLDQNVPSSVDHSVSDNNSVESENNISFYEDELQMIENVPVKEIRNKEVETVAMNMGNRVNKIKIRFLENSDYSIDGLVPQSVTHKRQPIITSDTIQWGCVDVVVSTVQSFAFEVVNSTRKGIYPVCVVFDEVDMLFENNANRSSIFEIISKLRPRPPSYNPLVDITKRTSRTPPPVQIINVGSTINFGGVQTCGTMLFEKFNTSRLVFGEGNHVINTDLNYEKTDPDRKLDCLVRVILNNPVKKTIIFCNSLKNCGLIYRTLVKHDWPVMSFHSRSALSTRLAILKTFEDDEPRILVATDLASRGINISVNHIINFDFPTSSSVFYHRIKSSNAKVTNIITEDSELSTQINHFSLNKKPINEILSRKRSLRKKLDRLKLERISRVKDRDSRPGYRPKVGSFFQSKLVIQDKVEGDSKYRRIPLKKRLMNMLNNYPS